MDYFCGLSFGSFLTDFQGVGDFMDFLISGLASFINSIASHLPQWSFTHNIASDVSTIQPYLNLANTLLPINTMLTLFGLWIGLQLMLIALYWIDRLINLIRGAG